MSARSSSTRSQRTLHETAADLPVTPIEERLAARAALAAFGTTSADHELSEDPTQFELAVAMWHRVHPEGVAV